MDLVLWQMTWHSSNTDWLTGACLFCSFDTEPLRAPVSTGQLLHASRHECGGHDDALRHVVYVRSGGKVGQEFTKMNGPGVIPGQVSSA